MGLALLRVNKMKEKWRLKIAHALVDKAKHHNARSWLGFQGSLFLDLGRETSVPCA
jgi:high-affinity iron transporter